MRSFLSRFHALVCFVLSGFDRLRLVGDSRLLNHAMGVQSYLWQRKVLFKDFRSHAEQLTGQLRTGTEALAQEQGIPFCYLNSPEIDKEAKALELVRNDPTRLGRIALLSCLESCSTYNVRKNAKGLLEVRKVPGRCLHYYHYFQHQRLGLCYVRIQSWFPFSVRVGLNGRQWLYRQLERRGIDFKSVGNLLTSVADPHRAQALLKEQCHADWPALLEKLVKPIHPLWSYLHEVAHTPYYWMVEQSEWASDFVFHSPKELAQWYPRFIRHGIKTLSCRDVLHYLGKKVPAHGYGACTQQAKIDLRTRDIRTRDIRTPGTRSEGTRLKWWHATNSIKMYDKEALALRIETTLNDPKGYKVFRTKETEEPGAAKSWQHLRKGVADIARRGEVCQAANNRLAESLACVAETLCLGELLKPLGQAVTNEKGRRFRALNPTGEDGQLLKALTQAEFLLNGFRNRDLRKLLCPASNDPKERKKQAAFVTRKLALLKAHALIVKVPKTHRYRLSAQGQRQITALLSAQQTDVKQLTEAA